MNQKSLIGLMILLTLFNTALIQKASATSGNHIKQYFDLDIHAKPNRNIISVNYEDQVRANSLNSRGVQKMGKKDYKGALADFNLAIKLDPNTAAYHGNRGICKRRLGDRKGAIQDLRLAIKLYRKADPLGSGLQSYGLEAARDHLRQLKASE
jgi:tetratricopeptide (TPR) repeat protein